MTNQDKKLKNKILEAITKRERAKVKEELLKEIEEEVKKIQIGVYGKGDLLLFLQTLRDKK